MQVSPLLLILQLCPHVNIFIPPPEERLSPSLSSQPVRDSLPHLLHDTYCSLARSMWQDDLVAVVHFVLKHLISGDRRPVRGGH